MKYFAHSTDDKSESSWQILADHLSEVGRLSAIKAKEFASSELAEVAGLLHDLGKYCPEFQKRLRGSPERVDHSTWGAKVVLQKYPKFGYLLAYAIAGHHAGLADGAELEKQQLITPLSDRLSADLKTKLDPVWEKEIALNLDPEIPVMKPEDDMGTFQLSVLGRMIFSCLVDSDYLDTEAFYKSIEGEAQRDANFPSLAQLHSELNCFLSQSKFQSNDGVNGIRSEILSHVRSQANNPPGLFTLNVPTGGGKTLSSLAFALDHAIKHKLRRVILVIPFTSIVEQNAKVWREALGELGEYAVLEHHSAFNEAKQSHSNPFTKDKLRQASENWEAPIVVTTAVQFFESLYANRPSRCRKLHNIANSVVILDEAQTLPTKLLKPCVAMIKELALNYHSSIVLCTATQPALGLNDGFRGGLEKVRELAPEPARLHKQLERVRVEHIGSLEDSELVEELRQQEQVLCIVNNRRHARALFDELRGEGAYHLTTLMCAEHRSRVLDKIRQRLQVGESVRLVSTSLIEAGVDVDFPIVYRADAGLDSIAQAAGRCNREGRRHPAESMVKVFTVGSDWSMPVELQQYSQAFHSVYRHHKDNLLSLAAIKSYFEQVYWLKQGELDAHQILKSIPSLQSIPYEQMANAFRMIESNMQPVIVPYSPKEGGRDVQNLINDLRYADRVGGIARRLQRYLVQVPEQGMKALMSGNAVQPVNQERFGYQFLELVNPDLYDPECGLSWQNSEFIKAEKLVF